MAAVFFSRKRGQANFPGRNNKQKILNRRLPQIIADQQTAKRRAQSVSDQHHRLTQIIFSPQRRPSTHRPIDRLRVVRKLEPQAQGKQRSQRIAFLFIGRRRQTNTCLQLAATAKEDMLLFRTHRIERPIYLVLDGVGFLWRKRYLLFSVGSGIA